MEAILSVFGKLLVENWMQECRRKWVGCCSGGTAHEGDGCNESIGSTVSDEIVRSWLWSTSTRSSSLGYFSGLLQVVDNWPHILWQLILHWEAPGHRRLYLYRKPTDWWCRVEYVYNKWSFVFVALWYPICMVRIGIEHGLPMKGFIVVILCSRRANIMIRSLT